jgi:molybdopterin/thiamine biosynthesis adenylyltransferase/rhodanese-related sulfurtransferase
MPLTSEEQIRYGRHLILPEVGPAGQEKLKAAKVLCVGAGGLGSPLMTYLAAAGVGTIGLVDDDTVDLSNLHRQPIHFTDDIGRPKIESAAEKLYAINPNVHLQLHDARLTSENAFQILKGYDIIADGTDNFAARYLVNDACVMLGKPNVHAAIYRFQGQISVFDAQRGPCYRCLFPEPPPPGTTPSCAEAGVFGVLPGIAGSMQAAEVIKIIVGFGRPLIGRLLTFDVADGRYHELRLEKDPGCPVCSENPTITTLIDYKDHCGPMKSATDELPEMSAQELRDLIETGGARPILVDVREPYEVMASRLPYKHHIPVGAFGERYTEIDRGDDIVIYCKSGIRSAAAVKFLIAQGYPHVRNLVGGIDAYMIAKPTVR